MADCREGGAIRTREREKRIIELEDIGRKIIFIAVRIGRFFYDGESGTAEVFHFVIKE